MHIHQGDFILRPLDPEDIHYLYRWLTDDCLRIL